VGSGRGVIRRKGTDRGRSYEERGGCKKGGEDKRLVEGIGVVESRV